MMPGQPATFIFKRREWDRLPICDKAAAFAQVRIDDDGSLYELVKQTKRTVWAILYVWVRKAGAA